MMKKIYLLIYLATFISGKCMAQEKVISGHVYAFKDTNLKNIAVTAKKSKTTVVTDDLGNYSIDCVKGDKLIFTGNGFETTNVKIRNQVVIDLKMVFITSHKNERRAIENGHVSEQELINALATYSDLNNDFNNYRDIYTLIQAKCVGVQVKSSGGTKQLFVRGPNSLNSSNAPMYVVDGNQVSDISHLKPNMIKEVKILKDGDTTVYGLNGVNGVIIINTVL